MLKNYYCQYKKVFNSQHFDFDIRWIRLITCVSKYIGGVTSPNGLQYSYKTIHLLASSVSELWQLSTEGNENAVYE